MNIWGLLKQYVRDTEIANNIQFSDEAWQRIKQLERDIQQYIYEAYEKPHMPNVTAELSTEERSK